MAESKPVPLYLILEALDNLLINYPYHPVLWTLYAVNRRFAARKPAICKNVEILNYSVVSNPWLSGITDALRDIIALDDKIEECWFAHATIRKGKTAVLYWIPREWVKRIIVNSRGNFMLLSFEFCCRQVLKRSECKLVRCQSHVIPQQFLLDQTYFHVGCGPCHQEISFVIAGFHLFVGIKQLALMLGEKFEVNTELIIALLNCDDNISLKLENVDKTSEEYDVKPSHVCKMLKHILVCKICNVKLEKFLSILDDYISGPAPFNEFDDKIDCEFYYSDAIPCNKYVIDGEFDEMRLNAFNAIETDDLGSEEYRHKIVDKFLETYCNSV
jgi:hypothetical protein